jgi:CRISP-associated protein Cas1
MSTSRAGGVLERASALRSLHDAWEVVHLNDKADGLTSASIERFADGLDVRLATASAELLAGTYKPSPLTAVTIEEGEPGPQDDRELHIPAVRDRIVERALVNALTPVIDPWLSPWSFGYRPGYGVGDALRTLVAEREAGAKFVFRTDVRHCFDELPRAGVASALAGWVDDDSLLALVRQLMERPYTSKRKLQHAERGVPQGGPLSPLLCNVYLHRFDMAMLRHGFHSIRYADDITIPTRSRAQAEEARRVAQNVLTEMELAIAEDKSAIMSFADGFAFLGEEVTGLYPGAELTEPVREPDRKALYVGKEGATVRVSKGQFHVSEDETDLLVVPTSQVGAICLFGNVGLSAGARQHALASGIDVSFASRRGTFQGWLQSALQGSTQLRRQQYRRNDDLDFCAALAARFVVGKIANLSALLRRYGNADHADDIVRAGHELENHARTASTGLPISSLLGVEGAASAAYFRVFGRLLPDEFHFETRTRQPPLDPVNAALSYGYTILASSAVTAVAMAGLDPTAGFLHSDSGNRPSLALDLMEEYRPLIVDTTVLKLFRKGSLTAAHFRREEKNNAVLFTEAGRKILIAGFEQRMLTVRSHTPTRMQASYRRSLFLQARQIGVCIRDGSADYQPVSQR